MQGLEPPFVVDEWKHRNGWGHHEGAVRVRKFCVRSIFRSPFNTAIKSVREPRVSTIRSASMNFHPISNRRIGGDSTHDSAPYTIISRGWGVLKYLTVQIFLMWFFFLWLWRTVVNTWCDLRFFSFCPFVGITVDHAPPKLSLVPSQNNPCTLPLYPLISYYVV